MKMCSKSISIILSFLLLFSVFVGCDKNDENNKAENQSLVNKNEEEKDEVKEEKVEINFMFWASKIKSYQPVLDAFTKEVPNIVVNMVETPDKEHTQKLAVSLAAGESIDVFGSKDANDTISLAQKELCYNLDEFIKRDNYDLANYTSALEDMRKFDGNLYGLSINQTAWFLFYNKDLFDAVGVSYPSNDMSWEEYANLAKKMTSGEGSEKIYGTFIQTWATPLFNMSIQRRHSIVEDSPDVFKDSFIILKKIYDDGSATNWAENKTTSAHYRSAFKSGKIAMLPIGNWLIKELVDAKKTGEIEFDFDIASIPHPSDIEANTTWGSLTPLSINSKSSEEKKDAAWELIKYYTGKKGATIVAKEGFDNPAYSDDEINGYKVNYEGAPLGINLIVDSKVLHEQSVGANAKTIERIYTDSADLFYTNEKDINETIEYIKDRIEKEIE